VGGLAVLQLNLRDAVRLARQIEVEAGAAMQLRV
ncbi:MAG: hypothetical protein RL695_2132, partial [Pseudomonadota bacterium]|jgi:hypothetical protein